ncbi:hypothetical protein Fmac_025186 [Flemingia macrophylla]|uniref:Uncharacterized protein n=1 Tax=Flemingia macrophylla TaxID=520843 RepID=A0ABD1LRI0_9FABA
MRLKPPLSRAPHAFEASYSLMLLKPYASEALCASELVKTLDEKHQLSSKATSKVVSLDQKVGLSEKISGTIMYLNIKLLSLEFYSSGASCVWSLVRRSLFRLEPFMRLKLPSYGASYAYRVSLRLKPHASETLLRLEPLMQPHASKASLSLKSHAFRASLTIALENL